MEFDVEPDVERCMGEMCVEALKVKVKVLG